MSAHQCLISVAVFLFGLALLRIVSAEVDDSLGRWDGNTFDMNVIPIHVMLIPGGQVLAYGANTRAKQGGNGVYEVWDTSGDHHLATNHISLRHSTNVNIFCSTLSMDVVTGNILVMGGDDEDNNGVNDVLEFNVETHEIRDHPLGDMKHPRWYGTSVNLPDGTIFIAGGESGVRKVASSIPELFEPGIGFQELRGADIPAMQRVISDQRAWWYPHVYVNSSGDIIMIIGDHKNSDVYLVGVEGRGSIEKIATRPFKSDKLGAGIMYDIDRVVMLDDEGVLWSVDISNSNNPIFTKKVDVGPRRTNAAMSILPDGRVLISGGCSTSEKQGNFVENAVRHVQIWDPVSNDLYNGPTEQLPRLYHSSGLILPDGTVFSAGGGAPGPLKNHNGEIYSPGYLFTRDSATGARQLAPRPVIQSGPGNILAGSKFQIIVDDSTMIQKVTTTKPGSMTHARNCDARWLNLPFVVIDDRTIEVTSFRREIMIGGLWYLNIINNEGVPSQAHIYGVNMGPSAPTTEPTSSPLPSAVPSSIPSVSPSSVPTESPTGAPSKSSSSTSVPASSGADDLAFSATNGESSDAARACSFTVPYVMLGTISFLLALGR